MIEATDEGLSDYERAIIPMRGDGRFRSDEDMLACCALGLAEEVAEVACAIDGRSMGDPVSEVGDVVWYATTAAHRLGFTEQRLTNDIETNTSLQDYDEDEDEDYVGEMAMHAGFFAGLIKKYLFHQKPLDRSHAVRCLAEIFECAERLGTQQGFTLDDARAANVAKLRKRFPSGGFTAAEANARADETQPEQEQLFDDAAGQALR